MGLNTGSRCRSSGTPGRRFDSDMVHDVNQVNVEQQKCVIKLELELQQTNLDP